MTLISNPKKEKKLPKYLNYEEIEKLLNSIEMDKKEGIQERLIIELLYSTGIRVSELVNIKIKDIKDINTKSNSAKVSKNKLITSLLIDKSNQSLITPNIMIEHITNMDKDDKPTIMNKNILTTP